MATPLVQILQQKKTEITGMEEAISFLEQGSQFPVDRSQMPVLAKLEAMLNQASSADERQTRLTLAKQALTESQKELEALEIELATLETSPL